MEEELKIEDVCSFEELASLGYTKVDGECVYSMNRSNVIDKKIGLCKHSRYAKFDGNGSLLMLEIFENTFSGELFSVFIKCSDNRIIIDTLSSKFEFMARISARTRKNNINRRFFKSTDVSSKDDLNMLLELFKLGGSKYFNDKFTQIQKMNKSGKVKYNSRNLLTMTFEKKISILN